MSYAVKEIFLTLQGEGFHTGRRAVFIRFAGCNLWSGREEDRDTAVCKFCDTDFVGGERRTALGIANRASELWGDMPGRFVVLTGGEPTLQITGELMGELAAHGFRVAVESNGTNAMHFAAWLTVSPKAGARLEQRSGDEIKVVWPQHLDLDELAALPFAHRYLQPMDGPSVEANTQATIEHCLADPRWRLSLQTHKVVGLR